MGHTILKLAVLDDAVLKDKDKVLVGRFIKHKDFNEIEILPEQLSEYISTGKIFAYLHRYPKFRKAAGYSDNNYKGAQVILVDVDGVSDDPETFISNIKYKPTAYCTSYSNKIKNSQHPNGDQEWRFHLYYAFDEIIYGIDNFNTVFDTIVADFPVYDAMVRSPRITIFTSYRDKPENKDFYKMGYTGMIHKVSALNLKENREPNYDYEYKEKMRAGNGSSIREKADYNLDPIFLKDLKTLGKKMFLEKYMYKYPYIGQTCINPLLYIDENGNDKPYADLRNIEFYLVPSEQKLWDSEKKKPKSVIVRNGQRHTRIYVDSNVLKKVIPNLTKEHLVYCIVHILYYHYADSYEFKPQDIINIARDAWYNENFDATSYKKNKKFRTNPKYWEEQSVYNTREQVRLSRIMMTDNDIYQYYEQTTNVDQIFREMHADGFKTKRERIIQFVDDNRLPYTTDKEERNRIVIKIYEEDKTKGYKKIAKLYKEYTGRHVSSNTVKNILINQTDKCRINWIAEVCKDL